MAQRQRAGLITPRSLDQNGLSVSTLSRLKKYNIKGQRLLKYAELKEDWHGQSYDLIAHNCQDIKRKILDALK